jgi:NAD(P)H-flavin reductase/truncated hemoglobin YjbI
MAKVVYEGRKYACHKGETILDALLRQGVNLPFSCRNGACLVCLQRCVKGKPPRSSQKAIRPSLQESGYFLPCVCVPAENMELAPPREADLFSSAVVKKKELLAKDVCRLRLDPSTPLYYHAGQFINVKRPDGLMRSYSLASVPMESSYLELHVKRSPGGQLSNWIFDELSVGDELEFHGPHGKCYYVHGSSGQNLLLVGNGTGAAPLMGIVRDALFSRHKGKILLFHGSRTAEGLYLHKQFLKLAQRHSHFQYFPCVSGDDVPKGYHRGRAHKVALARCPSLRNWHVYAAGHPQMAAEVETAALRAGATRSEIHADPYEMRDAFELPSGGSTIVKKQAPELVHAGSSLAKKQTTPSQAGLEMWKALGEGQLLNEILTDFYTRVFDDPVLAPYFRGITKDRLIGQVFSFMRDAFSGEKQYFGARPRTAHHWMVISDEIFDHRENLMMKCLVSHGLPKKLITRWRKFEETFRGDIVKSEPWKLVVNGVEVPLDGFGEIEVTVGSMCDGCQRAINVGEKVRYHLRLGMTYCVECSFTNPEIVPAGQTSSA